MVQDGYTVKVKVMFLLVDLLIYLYFVVPCPPLPWLKSRGVFRVSPGVLGGFRGRQAFGPDSGKTDLYIIRRVDK